MLRHLMEDQGYHEDVCKHGEWELGTSNTASIDINPDSLTNADSIDINTDVTVRIHPPILG